VTDAYVLYAILGVVGVLAAVGLWDSAQRWWQFRTYIPKLLAQGWTYDREDPSLRDCFGHGDPFLRRHKHDFTNVLRGSVHGMPTLVFTYNFFDQRHCTRTIVVLTLSRPLPRVMSPLYARYVEAGQPAFAAGGPDAHRADVTLRGGKGHGDDWTVWTESDEIARATLTSRMHELTKQRPELGWRVDGHAMIAWTTRTMGPRDSVAVAERCAAILREIPSEAWARGAREPNPWPGPCPERPA
jgi:hypothetical protein